AGVIVVLAVYGENVQAVGSALLHLHWGWLVVGLGLASMDWIGGGLRLWVVARHVHPGVRLKDMIIAGGMSAWAAYLTPFQSGAGPTMMWVMRRMGWPGGWGGRATAARIASSSCPTASTGSMNAWLRSAPRRAGWR